MNGKTIEQLQGEAAVLMAEIRPLKKRLNELTLEHSNLQQQILDIGRREAAIKKIAAGVSGRAKPRAIKKVSPTDFAKQFANLPAAVQAGLLAELRKEQGI